MNAYELADQVEMWGEDLLALNMKGGIPVVQGAKMLRQQADRIAELEKNLHMIQRHYDQLNTQTKPLSDEEISQVYKEISEPFGEKRLYEIHDFARAIEERHGIK